MLKKCTSAKVRLCIVTIVVAVVSGGRFDHLHPLNPPNANLSTLPPKVLPEVWTEPPALHHFDDASSRKKSKSAKPDHPGEAIAFRNLQWRDERGIIPLDALLRAKAHRDVMRAIVRQPSGAGITPASWTWLGPGNIGGAHPSHCSPSDSMAGWKRVGGGSGVR